MKKDEIQGVKSQVFFRILVLCLMLAASCVFATDYYVATTGADTNAGTLAQPFLTIQRAASVMTAGDTCYIRGGVYRETVTPAYSGTSGAHITFMPYNNEEVTISGCDLIDSGSWESCSGYIYRAALSSSAQVFLQAESYDSQSGGIAVGSYIGNCDDGEWVKFEDVDFGSGCSTLLTRLAVPSPYAGLPRHVEIRLDSLTGTLIGDIVTVDTGSWYTFEEQITNIVGAAGTHDVYFLFKGGSGVGAFDWFKFYSPSVTQVFAGGRRMNEARYPNQPLDEPMLAVNNWSSLTAYSDMNVKFDDVSRTRNYWMGGRTVVLCGQDNVTLYGLVDSSEGDTAHVTNGSYYNNWTLCQPYIGGGHGYIIGVLGELDCAGEWYAGGNYLYLWAPDNADPASLTVEARTRHMGMDLTDLDYIDVIGINFHAATIIMRDSSNCLVDECTVRYPRAFFNWNQSWCRASYIPPVNWEGTGIEISGSGNTVQNTYIAHSWGDGISVWGTSNTIDNCLVEDTDWAGIDCACLSATGSSHTISSNTLRLAGRCILVHRALGSSSITHNHMHDGGIFTEDQGITYTHKDKTPTTEIAYNLIHDNHNIGHGYGIYLDNSASNYLIHHNVVHNCFAGIHLNTVYSTSNSTNIDIFNNTIWDNSYGMLVGYHGGGYLDDVVVWNNLTDRDDLAGTDLQDNLFTLDDDFTDSATGDFSLTGSSSAVDEGRVISGITDGYYGTAPDIGAYEYGNTAWSVGADFAAPVFPDSFPLLPLNVYAQVLSSTSVDLYWDNCPGDLADQFTVEYRREDSGAFSLAATVASATTHLVINNLDPGYIYYFRVKALSDSGNSIFCRPVNAMLCSICLQAESYDNQSGGIETATYSIGNCDNDEWVKFEDVDFGSGCSGLLTRFAVPAPYAGLPRHIEVRLDSLTGILAGDIVTFDTGSWYIYDEQTTSITNATGTHDVYFLFKGGSGVGAFDWFRFY